MRIRCDGEQTRRRIFDAACNVFAQNGFRDATHEMICREARANKAAINYHFGDKKSLYRAVWQHLQQGDEPCVPDVDTGVIIHAQKIGGGGDQFHISRAHAGADRPDHLPERLRVNAFVHSIQVHPVHELVGDHRRPSVLI